MDVRTRRRHSKKVRSENLTQDQLKDHVIYYPHSGIFSWRKTRSGRKSICGYKAKDGYRHIMINATLYQEHRLAWLYMYGAIPSPRMIDHINRDRSDNRITNLRLCTESQNCHNRKIPNNNTSGLKGIRFKKNRWEVSCMIDGKRKYLGRFLARNEAISAYNEYLQGFYGKFVTLATGEVT